MKGSVGSQTLVDEGLKQTGGDGKTKRWQQAVAGDSRKYGRHYRSENVEVRGTNKHINPQQTGRDDGKDASPVCSLSLSLSLLLRLSHHLPASLLVPHQRASECVFKHLPRVFFSISLRVGVGAPE